MMEICELQFNKMNTYKKEQLNWKDNQNWKKEKKKKFSINLMIKLKESPNSLKLLKNQKLN